MQRIPIKNKLKTELTNSIRFENFEVISPRNVLGITRNFTTYKHTEVAYRTADSP